MARPWQGYYLRHLDRYKATWVRPKPVDLTKGSIPLTTGDSFSPELQELLGPGNITYIHGPEGPILEGVFEALLENEANERFYNGDNAEPIKKFSNMAEVLHCKLDRSGGLRWRISGKPEMTGGWVDFIGQAYNLPRMDALATLAQMLDMRIEDLKYPTNKYNHIDSCDYRHLREDIPKSLYLQRFATGNRVVELEDKVYIKDNGGNKIGAIVKYNLKGVRFCLPATVYQGVMCVGIRPPIACLLNQDSMERYPGSTILFFQDLRSALSMGKLLGGLCGYDPRNFIVTAHLGDNLAILPWNYLWGHDVILIPAPSKVDMSRVKLYKGYISGAGATSFRVFPGFMLHSPPRVELEQGRENLSSQEAALLRDTRFIDDKKMSLAGAQQIIEKAIPYDEYKAWGQDMGIFKRPKDSVATISSSALQGLPSPDPSEIPPAPRELEDVVLHHFIRPGSNVLVLGAKNAGKTQFALSVCQALRQKGVMCSIFHNEAKVPCKVAYVDAETPLDEFQANLKRYNLNNDDGFFGLSKFGDKPQGFPNSFSLIHQEFRDWLRDFIVEKGYRYVVLDNLTALMGNNVDYGSPAQEVIDWIEQLQIANICAVLIHHKTDFDAESTRYKGRGSRIFNIRARNVIELIGKDEILKHPASETIKTAALQEGLAIGIRFKTCKAAGLLDGKTFYAHLHLGAPHWDSLGATGADGQPIRLPAAKESLLPDKDTSGPPATGSLHDKLKGLSPDQRRVVEILEARPAKRAEIETQLDCCEDKALTVLNDLIDMKVIRRDGQGKSTYYALTDYE